MKRFVQGVFISAFLFGHGFAFLALLVGGTVLAAHGLGAVPLLSTPVKYALLLVALGAPIGAGLTFAHPKFRKQPSNMDGMPHQVAVVVNAIDDGRANLIGAYNRYYTPGFRLVYAVTACALFFAIRPLVRQVFKPLGLALLTLNALFALLVLGLMTLAYWLSCRGPAQRSAVGPRNFKQAGRPTFVGRVGLEDLSFQAALVAPPILAAAMSILAGYSALGIREHLEWSAGLIFPPHEVGPGDVAVVAALIILLVRWVVGWLLRRTPIKPWKTTGQYGPTTLQLVTSPTFVNFGNLVWGAAAGIATRRRTATARPTTGMLPPLVALTVSLAYHSVVGVITVAYLVPPTALLMLMLMLMLGSIGPIACISNIACAWPVHSWGGYFASLTWMAASTILWMFAFDVLYGARLILAMRRTIFRVEQGSATRSEAKKPTGQCLNILHLSDLHFVADGSAARVESWGEPPYGNAIIERRLADLVEEIERCHVLLLSGDLTDTGDRRQWRALRNITSKWPKRIRRKVFVIPGNHDVNFVTHRGRIAFDRDTVQLHGRQLRQANYAAFARNFVMPGDTFATPFGHEAAEEPANRWFETKREAMLRYRRSISRGNALQTNGNAYDWQVPIWIRRISVGALKIALFGIDTSRWGHSGLSNALGTDAGTLQELLVRSVPAVAAEGFLPVIVGHHAMLPIYERGPRAQRAKCEPFEPLFTAAAAQLYGDAWFESLVRNTPAPGFVYLHGHRHVSRYIATELLPGHRAYLMAAPSILYGDEWDDRRDKVASWHSISMPRDSGGSALLEVDSRAIYKQ